MPKTKLPRFIHQSSRKIRTKTGGVKRVVVKGHIRKPAGKSR